MAYREFTDPEGRSWMVWDTFPQSSLRQRLPGTFQGGWLCFERESERRRLAPVPLGWDQAPQAELCAWLRSAAPVRAKEGPLESRGIIGHRRLEDGLADGSVNPLRIDEGARAALVQSRETLRRVATILEKIGDPPRGDGYPGR